MNSVAYKFYLKYWVFYGFQQKIEFLRKIGKWKDVFYISKSKVEQQGVPAFHSDGGQVNSPGLTCYNRTN